MFTALSKTRLCSIPLLCKPSTFICDIIPNRKGTTLKHQITKDPRPFFRLKTQIKPFMGIGDSGGLKVVFQNGNLPPLDSFLNTQKKLHFQIKTSEPSSLPKCKLKTNMATSQLHLFSMGTCPFSNLVRKCPQSRQIFVPMARVPAAMFRHFGRREQGAIQYHKGPE